MFPKLEQSIDSVQSVGKVQMPKRVRRISKVCQNHLGPLNTPSILTSTNLDKDDPDGGTEARRYYKVDPLRSMRKQFQSKLK